MIAIRKMEPNEAGQVQKIGKNAFVGIESVFVSKPKEALVAVVDGNIVGGIIIKYIAVDEQKIGYFEAAFIDPHYHGQGIGKMLYKKTEDYLWEQGCTALSATVKDDNVGSWKLFLNNGFSQVTFWEGLRQLGVKAMLCQQFKTTVWISNGMEFYLKVKDKAVPSKKISTSKDIMLYLVVNALTMLLAVFSQGAAFPMFFSAYMALLLGGVCFSGIGCLFSKRGWHFRLNSCGLPLVGLLSFLGGAYPMVGNWYPETYEATDAFRKDLGVVAMWEWIGLMGMMGIALLLKENHMFFTSMAQLARVFLFYRIVALYPLDIYGGQRVYQWHKGIYGVLVIISVALMLWKY